MTKRLLLTLILLSASALLAEHNVSDPDLVIQSKPIESEHNRSEQKAALEQKKQQLEEMFVVISDQKAIIKELFEKIKRSKNSQEIVSLEAELEENQGRLLKLQTSFDEVAINGADISSPDAKKDDEKKSVQEKLLDIFEPLLVSLKRATEHPRQIEAVRSDIERYDEKLKDLGHALTSLDDAQKLNLSTPLQSNIVEMRKRIEQQESLYTHHLQALNTKLKELEANEESMMDNMSENTVAFVKGRGLNIVLAISGFIATMMLLLLFRKRLQARFEHIQQPKQLYLLRILQLVLGMFSAIMATLVALFIFYIRADWLMLTIFLLLLLGIGWSLKTYLPSFMDELKMMLNMGLVREHERVVYQGIPWKVENIGMSAVLVNPLLSAGEIRIDLARLRALTAREVVEDEQWFPTATGDYILFQGEQYGRIAFQSPEIVDIHTQGSAINSYSTLDFLAMNPINLSRNGFSVFETISLNQKHRDLITTKIPQIIQDEMQNILRQNPINEHLQTLSVAFDKATFYSLDLKVMVSCGGEAASEYPKIKRTIQQIALDITQEHGWKMPAIRPLAI